VLLHISILQIFVQENSANDNHYQLAVRRRYSNRTKIDLILSILTTKKQLIQEMQIHFVEEINQKGRLYGQKARSQHQPALLQSLY
jgi:hypothetical protein